MSLEGSGGSQPSLQQLSAGTIDIELAGGTVANLNASDEIRGDVSGGTRANVAGGARVNVIGGTPPLNTKGRLQ